MKKIILTVLSFLLGVSMQAQVNDYSDEATKESQSIDDIIKSQTEVQSKTKNIEHFTKVWKNGGYFNIAYNTTTITAIDDVPMYTDGEYKGEKPEFKSDWGVSLVWGHGYRLHKKAIANILGINLDFTWMDLNVNHFKAEAGEKLYDSGKKTSDNKYYLPYNLQKYQASYGMNFGPSITVAPFTPLNSKFLDFIKFQFYYHIGYRISAFYMINKDEMDAKTGTETDYQELKNDMKLSFGTNIYNTFGVNLSWHAIGFGYEFSSGKIKYKPSSKDTYGNDKIEMDNKTNKVYINFRF